MATKQSFDFALGAPVSLKRAPEVGTVIGRAHFMDCNPSYLVRYLAGGNRLTEAWWSESALEPATIESAEDDQSAAA